MSDDEIREGYRKAMVSEFTPEQEDEYVANYRIAQQNASLFAEHLINACRGSLPAAVAFLHAAYVVHRANRKTIVVDLTGLGSFPGREALAPFIEDRIIALIPEIKANLDAHCGQLDRPPLLP